ncbi:6-phospho-3-hexuloisomerase [Glycomyces tenuis]|uniref:6-phospho-3-hexuloisomerase n=1 Tax=Glycomyces tenuis TaxID=58116 RepID=UPI000402A7F2|nr:6-phospho-3-hexuloisomerase [Glycomyces tenuis]
MTLAGDTLQQILRELSADAERVDGTQIAAVVDRIAHSRRVFIAGAGRSGFAARAFANRLAHVGVPTFFVGEPTTPPIAAGDLLVIGSGSGKTTSLVSIAQKARELGASLATLTIHPENTIGQLADVVIRVPGVTAKADESDSSRSAGIQMTGSSFEQLSWLIYDTIIILLRDRTGQSNDDLFARHANLE